MNSDNILIVNTKEIIKICGFKELLYLDYMIEDLQPIINKIPVFLGDKTERSKNLEHYHEEIL